MNQARIRNSGFTLLEILIGMLLLSIMMTLLFGSIRMGARIWDAGEERAADVDQMLVVQTFLRDRLATARPVFDDFSSDEPAFSFSGTSDSIRFVSDLPSSARRGGLYQFALELVEEKDRNTLYAKIQVFHPPLEGADDETAIEDVRLLRDVDSIEFAYFGRDEPDLEAEDAQWTDEWAEKEFLPSLIRMDVRMADGKRWPSMMVSPKLVVVQDIGLIPADQEIN